MQHPIPLLTRSRQDRQSWFFFIQLTALKDWRSIQLTVSNSHGLVNEVFVMYSPWRSYGMSDKLQRLLSFSIMQIGIVLSIIFSFNRVEMHPMLSCDVKCDSGCFFLC